jgi:hypothetical protein
LIIILLSRWSRSARDRRLSLPLRISEEWQHPNSRSSKYTLSLEYQNWTMEHFCLDKITLDFRRRYIFLWSRYRSE